MKYLRYIFNCVRGRHEVVVLTVYARRPYVSFDDRGLAGQRFLVVCEHCMATWRFKTQSELQAWLVASPKIQPKEGYYDE